MEEKQASAAHRVLMQPYPRLVSWEQYKENVVSRSLLSVSVFPSFPPDIPSQSLSFSCSKWTRLCLLPSSCFFDFLPPGARDWGKKMRGHAGCHGGIDQFQFWDSAALVRIYLSWEFESHFHIFAVKVIFL